MNCLSVFQNWSESKCSNVMSPTRAEHFSWFLRVKFERSILFCLISAIRDEISSGPGCLGRRFLMGAFDLRALPIVPIPITDLFLRFQKFKIHIPLWILSRMPYTDFDEVNYLITTTIVPWKSWSKWSRNSWELYDKAWDSLFYQSSIKSSPSNLKGN